MTSHLELQLDAQIRAAGLPTPEREYRFAAIHIGLGKGIRKRLKRAGLRDWRFDRAWPGAMVAVELDGGIWTRGRHNRGAGFEGDCRKLNAAQLLGWRVFRFTGGMLDNDEAVPVIRAALEGKDESA